LASWISVIHAPIAFAGTDKLELLSSGMMSHLRAITATLRNVFRGATRDRESANIEQKGLLMGRVCTVCLHSERAEIDEALAAGEPFRNIPKRVSVSPSALFRHRDHLPQTLIKATEAQEISHADKLIVELGELVTKARELCDKAEAGGDLRTALAAIRELTRLIELRARIADELKDSQVNVLNVQLEPATAQRMAEIYLARHTP